jgi:hypothetical protein
MNVVTPSQKQNSFLSQFGNCFGRKGIYHKIFFPFQKIESPFAKISPKNSMMLPGVKHPRYPLGITGEK